MNNTDLWHSAISSISALSEDDATQLRARGFIVLPGPGMEGGSRRLSEAYDRAVARADAIDVHIGKSGGTTRIDDFVNREPEFDSIYVYPPLLAACYQVIGAPFKLSGMRARTLHPGARQERLHVDVKYRANGWPLVGCIWMVDAFDDSNGATRFVPSTHLESREPDEAMSDPAQCHEDEVLTCGAAGSVIIFNASTWHGHGVNRSDKPRRSIQAHFVPRGASASSNDHAGRMRHETLARISDLAKYILDVESA